jgi:hypothetical protein
MATGDNQRIPSALDVHTPARKKPTAFFRDAAVRGKMRDEMRGMAATFGVILSGSVCAAHPMIIYLMKTWSALSSGAVVGFLIFALRKKRRTKCRQSAMTITISELARSRICLKSVPYLKACS